MIKTLVDFALKNRLLILAVAILLFVWGAISFHNLPVDAYPDVADNYVNIITQWPGHSAEDIEKQITVPTEIAMAGVPDMTNLRSFSLAGISSLMMNFSDDSDNSWNRERVLERLGMVTLPAGLVPQLQTDWSPAGQIYWYTIESKNPEYDVMEQKSLEDWTLEKQFKSVPGIVDVASFGGITKEYQIRLDPDKLISYGLSIAQVEQQLQNNNTNAGGSFIVAGAQQINVQAVGLYQNVQQIENTVVKTQNGTALRIKDIAVVEQGAKIRLGQISKTYKDVNGRLIDNPDVVEGALLLQKGADADPALKGIEAKVKELNDHILPKGVKVVPFLDRSELIHLTTHTVLHNLTRRHHPGGHHPDAVSGQYSGCDHCGADDSVCAVVCVDLPELEAYSGEPAVAGRAGLRHGGGRLGGDDREHRSPSASSLGERRRESVQDKIRDAAHEIQRPVFYAIGIIITAYLPIFTLQAVEGRLFKPMAWTVAFALLGALIFSMIVAPVLASFLFRKGAKEWHNPVMEFLAARYRSGVVWAIHHRGVMVGVGGASLVLAIYLLYGGVIGSEFLPHLDEGAMWVRGSLAPVDGTGRGAGDLEQGADRAGQLSRGDRGGGPDRAAGRWHGYDRILRYGVLRQSEAEGAVAAGLPREQGRSDCVDEPATGEDSGRDLGLLAAD